MTDDKAKAEALLEESKHQKRHETEPTREPTDDTPTLHEAISEAYTALDDGTENENLTVRDRHLSALVAGLDTTNRLTDLGDAAADALDRDTDPETRADVLRLLLRHAIDDLDSDVLDAGRDGLKAYQDQQADDVF